MPSVLYCNLNAECTPLNSVLCGLVLPTERNERALVKEAISANSLISPREKPGP